MTRRAKKLMPRKTTDAGTDTSDDAAFSSRVKGEDKDKTAGFKKGRSVKKKKKGYAMGGAMKKKGYAKGGMTKKGYAMGGAMKKKGMAKGGKVRGAGIARKGVRPAKMR
tara:strand:+ start:836 stop:1162 length:327 start_codon:yes stop_codon:yes gene_type:complete